MLGQSREGVTEVTDFPGIWITGSFGSGEGVCFNWKTWEYVHEATACYLSPGDLQVKSSAHLSSNLPTFQKRFLKSGGTPLIPLDSTLPPQGLSWTVEAADSVKMQNPALQPERL